MTLSISSPDELVAVIPHLLGFKLSRTNRSKCSRASSNRLPHDWILGGSLWVAQRSHDGGWLGEGERVLDVLTLSPTPASRARAIASARV